MKVLTSNVDATQILPVPSTQTLHVGFWEGLPGPVLTCSILQNLKKGAAGYRKLQIHLPSLEGNTWDLGYLSLKRALDLSRVSSWERDEGGRAEALGWLWSSGSVSPAGVVGGGGGGWWSSMDRKVDLASGLVSSLCCLSQELHAGELQDI